MDPHTINADPHHCFLTGAINVNKIKDRQPIQYLCIKEVLKKGVILGGPTTKRGEGSKGRTTRDKQKCRKKYDN